MKSLYLFVDSERPDQYLNPLVFCILQHDVRRIVFLHIKGLRDTDSTGLSVDGLSGRVMAAVQGQLEGLAERGEYICSSGTHSGQHVMLATEYGDEEARRIREYYGRCRKLPISFSNEELDYDNLRTRLRTIAREGRAAFVDVTAVKKRYLGDVVAAGLVEGLTGLFTFDLTSQLDFEHPWRMLIHDLEKGERIRFLYLNLLDTPLYRTCTKLVVIRAPRLIAAVAATVLTLILVLVGYRMVGADSAIIQVGFVVSALASVLSLVFVFLPPRGNQ